MRADSLKLNIIDSRFYYIFIYLNGSAFARYCSIIKVMMTIISNNNDNNTMYFSFKDLKIAIVDNVVETF